MNECKIVTLISNFMRSNINSKFWLTTKMQHVTIIALKARLRLHFDLSRRDYVEGRRPKYRHSFNNKMRSSSEAMNRFKAKKAPSKYQKSGCRGWQVLLKMNKLKGVTNRVTLLWSTLMSSFVFFLLN